MHFPTWVDLKGEDSVPETVHHVVVPVNPKMDRLWERMGRNHIRVCRKEALALRFMSCKCKIIKHFLHLMFARLMRSTLKITPDLELILLVRQRRSRLDRLTRLSLASQTPADVGFWLLLTKECVFVLEMWSEAIKILKGEYTVRAIKEHKMDQAIIFCRTKIDCDNMEQYFIQQGGGGRSQREKPLKKKLKKQNYEIIL